MDWLEFWTICSANGIVMDKDQIDVVKRYVGELQKWNNKVNLISRKDEDNIPTKHILHSLSFLKYYQMPNKAICLDVGTGGGLPGIPISIARPDINMTLVDSISKKMKITSMLADHTGRKKLRAICSRAEDLVSDKQHRYRYDFIFARAVKRMERVLDWVKPLLKKKGKVVFYKGGDLTEEIEEAKKIFPKLFVEEKDIDIIGIDSFKKEDKKLIVCWFSNDK
jgi:16S rRNA (guanine527-N7)-methyltransferase